MRILETRWFRRWAEREGLDDARLRAAVEKIERGLIDAVLGSGLIKKRLRRPGGGKSAGWRTLLVYRSRDRAVFVYGFAKNVRDNIAPGELRALR